METTEGGFVPQVKEETCAVALQKTGRRLMTVSRHGEDDVEEGSVHDHDDDDDAGFSREEATASILLSLCMAGEALVPCRLAASPVWGEPAY